VQVLATYGSATLELVLYALVVAFIVGIPLGWSPRTARPWPDACCASGDPLLRDARLLRGPAAKLVFSVWLGWLPVSGRASTAPSSLIGREHGTGIYLSTRSPRQRPGILDVLCTRSCPRSRSAAHRGHLPAARAHERHRHAHAHIDAGARAACASTASSHARVQARAHPDHHGHRPADRAHARRRCSPRRPSSGRARLPAGAYLKARDFVAVQGIVAMIAVIVAVTNFIVDIIAAFIDPRVRY
jgi:peptide/nickel transport system permease protein